MPTISELLIAEARRRGVSNDALRKEMQGHREWFTGAKIPRRRHLPKIASVLGCAEQDLIFGWEDEVRARGYIPDRGPSEWITEDTRIWCQGANEPHPEQARNFPVDARRNGGRASFCRSCMSQRRKQHEVTRSGRERAETLREARCQQVYNEWLSKWHHRCAYPECDEQDTSIFDADHLPEFVKIANVAALRKVSHVAFGNELAKCQPLCPNHHVIVTHTRRGPRRHKLSPSVLRARDFERAIRENRPCVDCGRVYPLPVMEWDHDQGIKGEQVSNLVSRGAPNELIEQEISRCSLRCRNCHVKITRQRRAASVITKRTSLPSWRRSDKWTFARPSLAKGDAEMLRAALLLDTVTWNAEANETFAYATRRARLVLAASDATSFQEAATASGESLWMARNTLEGWGAQGVHFVVTAGVQRDLAACFLLSSLDPVSPDSLRSAVRAAGMSTKQFSVERFERRHGPLEQVAPRWKDVNQETTQRLGRLLLVGPASVDVSIAS